MYAAPGYLHDLPYRRLHDPKVERRLQVISPHIVIDGGLFVVGALKQHPRLQHRQWISVFDFLREFLTIFNTDKTERFSCCCFNFNTFPKPASLASLAMV